MFATATNEQLTRVDEILQQLDQSQPATPGENRRHAARLNIRTTMTALILAETGDTNLTIFTRNLSTSGIGFVCRRLCKLGDRLALSFELPERPRKLVLAQITFCRYIRAGLYETGAEFKECVTGTEAGERVPSHWIPGVQLKGVCVAPRPPARP